MADHSNDESMDRLSSSDPATGSHPDLHSLRRLIAHRAPGSAGTPTGADSATGVDDDLLHGPRLRAPWVAAAAVAALGVGVGGYALGIQQGERTVIVADSPLTPAAQGAMPGLMPGMADELGAAEAVEDVMTSSDSVDSDMGGGDMAYDPGPVTLVAGPGLSTDRATGQMSAVLATQEPQEFLDSWSQATGFTGQPVPDADGFFGGTGLVDGHSGQLMTVYDEGGALTYSFSDLYREEYCSEMYTGMAEEDQAIIRQEWTSAYGDTLPMPGPDTCIAPTGPRPSDEEAIAVATAFLDDVGVAGDEYTVQTSEWADADSAYVAVEAWPDGDEFGPLHVSLTVTSDGVVNAYGVVGEKTSLGDYQLISPTEAVERYAQTQFSTSYSIDVPVLYEESDPDSSLEFVDYELPETAPTEPGMKLTLLLKEKTVVDAELIQGNLWTDSGPVEVPTWNLITQDGMSYPVLALAEEEIVWQSWE